jgi:putative two-component system response regulator
MEEDALSDKPVILVVGGREADCRALSELFSGRYEIVGTPGEKGAIEIIRDGSPDPAAILLGMVAPPDDGFGVLEAMHESGKIASIPAILVVDGDDEEITLKGYNLGVSDVIRRPFTASVVDRRVANIIDLYSHKNHLEEKFMAQKGRLARQEDRIRQMNASVVDVLSSIVGFRDVGAGRHILRSRMFTGLMLENLREKYPLSERQTELISSAAALHDVGKIAIPDAILLKPGRLTKDEYEVMKTHTTRGAEIMDRTSMQDREYHMYCRDICLYHHERYDGRGYPEGLEGDEIPVWAQVVSLTDVYDALTGRRVYRPAYTHEQAEGMILDGVCGQFNPEILDVFERISPELKELAEEYADCPDGKR